jgi:hypothetical protein
MNRSARPRRDFNFFSFFPLLARYQVAINPFSTTGAGYLRTNPAVSASPSLRSFPFVLVFLFLAMTTSPVDVCAQVISLSVFLASIGKPRHTIPWS